MKNRVIVSLAIGTLPSIVIVVIAAFGMSSAASGFWGMMGLGILLSQPLIFHAMYKLSGIAQSSVLFESSVFLLSLFADLIVSYLAAIIAGLLLLTVINKEDIDKSTFRNVVITLIVFLVLKIALIFIGNKVT
ncbi:MAG: hypothetical protein HZC28_05060 [Spirochaetes bacterium]|nr:hypothetical protein [Spirochaetota bacterium]